MLNALGSDYTFLLRKLTWFVSGLWAQGHTWKKNFCVLGWVWVDFAHGRDMNNCPHEGWLQWIYFISSPNCSPLPGSTPCSPWNFAVSPSVGRAPSCWIWSHNLLACGHFWLILKVSNPITSFLLPTQAEFGYQSVVSYTSFSGIWRKEECTLGCQ